MQDELRLLEEAVEKITAKAREFGLDFYDMYFEICPADVIYTFGAYGMPTRFSHWTFGKAYHKMKTMYDYNLSKIYELVINSDPCYAFLLEGNSLIQNKMVIAHVLAHSDFFKNNAHFRKTAGHMVESMGSAAQRFREYELKYGRDKVEAFLDAVISIQEHVNPYPQKSGGTEENRPAAEKGESCAGAGGSSGCAAAGARAGQSCAGPGGGKTGGTCAARGGTCIGAGGRGGVGTRAGRTGKRRETPYDDLWELDERGSERPGQKEEIKKFPEQPEKDLLLFIMEHARDLEEWQRDVISVVRQEMLYFWPQMETKIMNEGWATYWHLRIMREIDLTEEETIEFAKMHAGVIQTSRFRLNPYYLGLKIFESIEKRWDEPPEEERKKFGRAGGEGRKKIFEVRELENDVSFMRNYLTEELVKELDLYLYKKQGQEWKIVEKDWEKVRDGIVAGLTNCGYPYLVVEDGDFNRRGELYLRHCFEGSELDVYYLEKTLPYVHRLWGRTVHLETVLDGKKVLFTFSGEKVGKKFL
ncbi:MAG: SpoVR family protein [Bacillota bacterium]